MKFNGSNWVNVGQSNFSEGSVEYISFALDNNNTPYVVYRNNYYVPEKATVMKFDGNNWVFVGAASGFSAADAYGTTIAFNSANIPYVAFKDVGNGWKATVMKIDKEGASVNESSLTDNSFTIHPNPTDGFATITNGEQGITNVEVYDVFGRPVPFKFDIGRSLLDIRSSPPGVYFVRLVLSGVEGVEAVRKLVKH